MRLDSRFVLAAAETITIHLLLVVAAHSVMLTHPYVPRRAPRIDLVEIEPIVPPPPPPVAKPIEPPKEEAPKPTRPKTVRREITPPTPETPPKDDAPVSDTIPGGDVVVMDDIGIDAKGTVPVMPGKRNGGHLGGNGSGTGSGTGPGTGETPAPVSVATIKTRALPKGDYSYFKDYPAPARQLGIEGAIRVRLVVDTDGKVVSAVLLNKLGHGLDELALDRAKQIEFTPAKDSDDKPVSSVVVWTFHMTLPK